MNLPDEKRLDIDGYLRPFEVDTASTEAEMLSMVAITLWAYDNTSPKVTLNVCHSGMLGPVAVTDLAEMISALGSEPGIDDRLKIRALEQLKNCIDVQIGRIAVSNAGLKSF